MINIVIYTLGCIISLAGWIGTILSGLSKNNEILFLANNEIKGMKAEDFIPMTIFITLISWLGVAICIYAHFHFSDGDVDER